MIKLMPYRMYSYRAQQFQARRFAPAPRKLDDSGFGRGGSCRLYDEIAPEPEDEED